MHDLATIVRQNNQAQKVSDNFRRALSAYGAALQGGDAFGQAFEDLVAAARAHQVHYGCKSAALRLQGQLNGAFARLRHPLDSGLWQGEDVGEQP